MLPIRRKLDELRNTTVFYTLQGAAQTVYVKVKGLLDPLSSDRETHILVTVLLRERKRHTDRGISSTTR